MVTVSSKSYWFSRLHLLSFSSSCLWPLRLGFYLSQGALSNPLDLDGMSPLGPHGLSWLAYSLCTPWLSSLNRALKQQQASLICLVSPCPAQGLVLRTVYHIGYVSSCATIFHISMPWMSCFLCLEFSFPSYLLVWLLGFFSTQIHNYLLSLSAVFPHFCMSGPLHLITVYGSGWFLVFLPNLKAEAVSSLYFFICRICQVSISWIDESLSRYLGRRSKEWLVHSVTLIQVTWWEQIRTRIFKISRMQSVVPLVIPL